MKVLFFQNHPMWIHGLPNGFQDLGHEVKVSGELTKENVEQMILNFKPDLVITIGWTNETVGEKVNWIRKYIKLYKITHIYWATEDPTHTFSFTLPLIQKMQPDFVFTICQERVDYYKKLGIKAAHLDFGFHPSVHYFTGVQDKYHCSIAVVANGYPKNLTLYPNHYRIQSIKTLIAPLVKENIRIDFFGWGWENLSFILGQDIPKEWIHGYLDYTLANQVYSSSDIILGIQNHRTQVTQRTYEILASRGFLITSDTPKIRSLFTPEKDLVVSSSPQETLDLVKYYLKEKDKCDEIRKQGQKSVSIHHYKYRAKEMLDILKIEKLLPV
ncbi:MULTISPECIES: glycosyltransferase [Clostridium]|uniref:Spore protein YkvP n=1 Tax=Clostridium ragsdalei P11 TaxID=1353534 RepID=A0A1A6AS00_9CLOT|nr:MULTISPECIES: glycosyltransferase [Clostridium]OBR92844.1 spore protein YkvP [Clostridium ragsdalei P11]QXE18942.1 peptigoglycan-binding protein LysM [Clostridium sp. 001]